MSADPPAPPVPDDQPEPAPAPDVVRLEVVRQDAAPGSPPRTDVFEVPCTERTTVLDALDWVKQHVDPSLTFRWSCRMGLCGSCGVMVNDRPVLGCETLARDYRRTGLVVGPLAHHEVLRDLVVDTDGLVERLTRASTWLVPAAPADTDAPADASGAGTQTPGELAAFRGLAQCIDCMLCYAACPQLDVVPDFLGPAAVATARRWDLDPRDHGDVLRGAALDTETGIWPCIQVGACTNACPKGVDPAKALRDAQRLAMG